MHSRGIKISLKGDKPKSRGRHSCTSSKFQQQRKIQSNRRESNKPYKKKDWLKVRRFKCDKIGHSHKRIQVALAAIKEERKEVEENHAFYLALFSELNSNKNTWIIDSGASRHIIF